MKILFFTSKPILPSVDGGCYASEKLLSCLLNEKIDVRYATLSTNKHPFRMADFPSVLRDQIHPKNYFVNTDVKPIHAAFHLLKSGSYNANRFYSKEVESDLIAYIIKEQFDGIILDSLYTLSYFAGIRSVFKGKMVARTHNIEHQLWQQYAMESTGIKAWYLRRLARDLKIFEIDSLSKVDAIMSISPDDSIAFKELGIETPIVEIPVAIAIESVPSSHAENRIYHLGMMDWEPNRLAVKELVSWMPELRARHPKIELHLAGSGSKEFINQNEEQGIFVHGFVQCSDEFSRNHGVLVSPIRAASGVRIKFLEAMSLGVPIITTEKGALGVDYTKTHCLCIAETKVDFFDQISELISNPLKQEEIGRNAQDYINKNHSIDLISKRIVGIFD